MADMIARLYAAGRLSAAGVTAAAQRGWITAEQAEAILA